MEMDALREQEPRSLQTTSELLRFMDENDILFHLKENEAELLLGYLEGHGYVFGEKDGTLFLGDRNDTPGEIHWEESSIDDAIDSACEWNYSMIMDTKGKMENPVNFIDFVNHNSRLGQLQEEEKILDVMFDRTSYGKALDEAAKVLADEFIHDMNSKDGIDGAIKRMEEKIANGQSVSAVQDIVQEMGRAR